MLVLGIAALVTIPVRHVEVVLVDLYWKRSMLVGVFGSVRTVKPPLPVAGRPTATRAQAPATAAPPGGNDPKTIRPPFDGNASAATRPLSEENESETE